MASHPCWSPSPSPVSCLSLECTPRHMLLVALSAQWMESEIRQGCPVLRPQRPGEGQPQQVSYPFVRCAGERILPLLRFPVSRGRWFLNHSPSTFTGDKSLIPSSLMER